MSLAMLAPSPSSAQPAADDDSSAVASDENAAAEKLSLLAMIFSGGLTGFMFIAFLFALSVGTAALVIEHFLSIRPHVLMPSGLAEQVQQHLLSGQVTQAEAACRQNPSFLAFVLQAGVAEVDGGWSAVEKAMEDAAAEQSARLFRKIEYLSVIGNIAPMVGLLGTVVGMIFAFQEISITQGSAKAGELAGNISIALVTTVGGLLVAIPALSAFAIFRNRVDQLVAEGSYMALHVFAPLKRRRANPRRGTPTPPAPPEGLSP
ncbi:MAG: MotA/TolQ/ExbB proton channel family protein [Pirellulales bacterium]